MRFDISGMLEQGENALGVILGNGWYNQRDRREEGLDVVSIHLDSFCNYKLNIMMGQRKKSLAMTRGKYLTGALLHDGIFTGEVYDSRLDPVGWNITGFNDSHWQSAKLVRPPTGKLQAQLTPSDKGCKEYQTNIQN